MDSVFFSFSSQKGSHSPKSVFSPLSLTLVPIHQLLGGELVVCAPDPHHSPSNKFSFSVAYWLSWLKVKFHGTNMIKRRLNGSSHVSTQAKKQTFGLPYISTFPPSPILNILPNHINSIEQNLDTVPGFRRFKNE